MKQSFFSFKVKHWFIFDATYGHLLNISFCIKGNTKVNLKLRIPMKISNFQNENIYVDLGLHV